MQTLASATVSRLSRRQALAGFGGVSLGALLAACSGDDDAPTAKVETSEGTTSRFDDAATCTQTAEQTEGPFYFDVDRVRSDIREDRRGRHSAPGVRVRDAADCEPIQNASCDIWHCDAEGSYSEPGETYLRGAQVTNADGDRRVHHGVPAAGHPGRTVHIHGKVHLDKETVLTTQFYFDDTVSAHVFVQDPYPRAESNRDGFNDSRRPLRRATWSSRSRASDDGYRGLMTLDVARA